jgi:glyoxylase-like metal-dependent hydrolase (beta-lactamase superfamily II)
MRRWLLVLAALFGAALVVLVLVLASAHREMRSIDPPLPSAAVVTRADAGDDLPVRLRWIGTASQAMARSAVLEPGVDPDPGARYVMSHAAFVLEWSDGRIFLLDLGMDEASAPAFGRNLEWMAGAEPIAFHTSAAARLGDAVHRVRGLAFTHLHTDHTAGIAELCQARSEPLSLFQTRNQAERANYTTSPGVAQIESAGCLEPERLEGAALMPVPGFPGLAVVAAGGHTPGSQVFVAHVRAGREVRTWIFTGDVVNHLDAVRFDLPKPRLYSLLVVPEWPDRLQRLRVWLRDLVQTHGASILVSHDELAIEASGLLQWGAPDR